MTPHEKGNESDRIPSDNVLDPDESWLMFPLNDALIEIINTSGHQNRSECVKPA